MPRPVRLFILLLVGWLVLSRLAYAQTAPTAHWATPWGTVGDDRHTYVALDGAGNTYSAGWTQPLSAEPTRLSVVKNDAQGRQVWARQWQCTNGAIEPKGIGVDSSGNVWIAGSFGRYYWSTGGATHTVTFGTTVLTANNGMSSEIFLLKLSPAGAVLWARQTQSPLNSQCAGLAVDAAGNDYVTGHTNQGARFGTLATSAAPSLRTAFVTCYNAQGTAQWLQLLGEGWGGSPQVATDATGACYLLGFAGTSFTLGSATVVVPANSATAVSFLAKLSPQGSVLWVQQLPPGPSLLAVSAGGDIRLAMQLTDSTTFGSQTFVPLGRDDVLCLGFSPLGLYQWGVQLGGATTDIGNSDSPYAVAVDADGNSYFIMHLSGMTTITQPNNLTDTQQFLVSFSPAGAVRWSRMMPHDCWALALAVVSPDQLQLSGETLRPVALDAYWLTSAGNKDAFTARLALGPSPPLPPTTPPTTPPAPPAAFIPNIITPNGDGLNDTFAPRDLPSGYWQFSVYSRWGQQVYLTNNYQLDWAATGLPAGLYYYRLQAEGLPAYQGWVEVAR